MFETAEVGRRIRKRDYKEMVPHLRETLLQAQLRLRDAKVPLIVLFAGVDGAGKGEVTNLLNEWMDPRWVVTRAYEAPSEEERDRPDHWRFWRDLPAAGQVGLFLSAWYSRPLLDRVYGGTIERLDHQLDEIVTLEEMLTADGAVVLKLWMHLSRDAQKRRLEQLAADPDQAWRVTDRDWKHYELYDEFIAAAERIITRTSTADAPWHIIEGVDPRYRSVKVATLLREAIQRRIRQIEAEAAAARVLAQGAVEHAAPALPDGNPLETLERSTARTVLDRLDMSLTVARKHYKTELKRQQARLNLLHRRARQQRLSTILVFEGWDAGGKGGAIRRLLPAIDARSVQVIPIARPTDEEYAHHYLWRFWRHLPRAGRVTIFDRSWYGRVLVERVEGFATEDEWRRAYTEINHFESQLVAHGDVVLKFWLHITPEEQLARFEARAATPHKAWKLTDEDWRNRERWDDYVAAVHDMVERTSTRQAPWILVEGNDKKHARLKVIRSVCDALEAALDAREG
ncbi:MAG: polyphosphate:AMP phosphotransferase [Deltaproteobacteria bacterium]|nr:MAG: polyphosphate:AMP phosphotransferase [Deltaproteobacteria bacterium]